MESRARGCGGAWWQSGLRRRMNVLGLAMVFTSGYLAGVAIFDETRGHALDSTPVGPLAAAWTVQTPPPVRADVGVATQGRATRPHPPARAPSAPASLPWCLRLSPLDPPPPWGRVTGSAVS